MGKSRWKISWIPRVDPDQVSAGDIEAASILYLPWVDIYCAIAQGDFEELFNSELANIERTNTGDQKPYPSINYICSRWLIYHPRYGSDRL